MLDPIKRNLLIHVTEVPEGKNRNGPETAAKEIMAKDFPKHIKDIESQN